jgi:hypothetical protein
MADSRGEGDALVAVEDRPEQKHVGKMHAPVIGVVEDESVARRDVLPEPLEHG